MAETNSNVSLRQNPTLDSLFHFLDPVSHILNQNSNSDQFVPLKLTSTEDFYLMERGPRYEAYVELRERMLRMKYLRQQEFDVELEQEPEFKLTPPRKQVKFQSNLVSGRKGSSFLAQSVPAPTKIAGSAWCVAEETFGQTLMRKDGAAQLLLTKKIEFEQLFKKKNLSLFEFGNITKLPSRF